ncbi:wax synthase family protein [Cytophaga hutchinsonii]|uniref:wax synthase family protein n=1 Tax=Cytophaga hutchinsonii TaxID=985 RepID=UPI000038F036|nr:membrane bound O-acyl transferase family-domain-containing protein [Cytophaga hutchinsonii]SFX87647.1 Membrane bound O-acyl transferase family protein [Cytophaga hutchinsonii ATCC 33406]
MDLITGVLLSWGVFLLLIGYFIPYINNLYFARALAWLIVMGTALVSITLTLSAAPIYRMIAIASLQLISMKVIVLVETYRGKPTLTYLQWLVFAMGWFGMRPRLFETFPSSPLPDVMAFVVKGISRIIIGLLLLIASVYAEKEFSAVYFFYELLMLVGLSFILHFGILNLSTASWRFSGVDVKELFRAPYKATSLKEFWGRRWNMAFSEMTAVVVYKPLKNVYGITAAMIASFLISGLLHEIAISFPVKTGYGLPFLYFIMHGLVMLAESKISLVKKIILHPIAAHIWVFAWLILPMPLLFHKTFIIEVVQPLRDFIVHIIGL